MAKRSTSRLKGKSITISEENERLKGANQRLTKENDNLKGKLASENEKAFRKLRTVLAAANMCSENADHAVAQEKERPIRNGAGRSKSSTGQTKPKTRPEILSVPEIKQFWEMILRQKAFLEEMNQRIAKAVNALYVFAKNRDLISSRGGAEVSIGNGIIAEAIVKGLDPTDEGQQKKAAKACLARSTGKERINPAVIWPRPVPNISVKR